MNNEQPAQDFRIRTEETGFPSRAKLSDPMTWEAAKAEIAAVAKSAFIVTDQSEVFVTYERESGAKFTAEIVEA